FMNNNIQKTLKQIVERYGPDAYATPQRCEALLRDLAGKHKREIFVLVSALEEGVVNDLQTQHSQVPIDVTVARAAAKLQAALALTEDAARWAVETWAFALGLLSAPVDTGGDALQATRAQTLEGHTAGVSGLAFSPNSGSLLSSSLDATARLWKIPTGEAGATAHDTRGVFTCAAFSHDGTTAALGSTSGAVSLWPVGLRTGGVFELLGHTAQVGGMAFAPDGRRLATIGADGTLRIWDVAARREIKQLPDGGAAATGLAYSPDGQLLAAAGGWDRTTHLWDVTSGKPVRDYTGHTSQVCDAAFSPSGKYLATCGWDESIRVWSLLSGSPPQVWNERSSQVALFFSLAYHPGERLVASGSWDGYVRLWDTEQGRVVRSLNEHTGPVLRVAISPDGRWLASGGEDGNIILWALR
ncbi:MAG: WD40 repeat domain-containing protein, partial [Anaerolineae bacterium]|nr:WD40 repeat domain-containing protein [Anaerolineae bacterium]